MRSFLISAFRFALFLLATQVIAAESANQLSAKEQANAWKLLFDGRTTHGWHTFKSSSFPSEGWIVEGHKKEFMPRYDDEDHIPPSLEDATSHTGLTAVLTQP